MKKFSSLLVLLLLALASFSAQAQEPLRGDVNHDGAVNISDVTSLIDNMLNGVSEGDVDQDGTINISDVTCLLDYLLSGSWPDDPVTPPDPHGWVDLGLPSGTLWATHNIGAISPEDFGAYFAWGETAPKSYYDWSNYRWCNGGSWARITKYCYNKDWGDNGFTDNIMELELEDDAAYVNWGASWRMPSLEQIGELRNKCTQQFTHYNGVYGLLLTGPNGNTLFFPAAGYRSASSLYNAGTIGYYWTRRIYGGGCADANILKFESFLDGYHSLRCDGLPVRPVRASQN